MRKEKGRASDVRFSDMLRFEYLEREAAMGKELMKEGALSWGRR